MGREQRMVDVEVRIHHETDKALLISMDDTNKQWLPKNINGEPFAVDEGAKGYAIITVPEWWAADKGLI